MMQQFSDFLKQAEKYASLTFGDAPSTPNATSQPKVILIEDIPFLSTPSLRREFQQRIRTFLDSKRTLYPLVFIISDFFEDPEAFDTRKGTNYSSSSFSSMGSQALHLRDLFPQDILLHHYVRNIT